jgi:hypothetical protein
VDTKPLAGITAADIDVLFAGPPVRILVNSDMLAKAVCAGDRSIINRAVLDGLLRPTSISPKKRGYSRSAVLAWLQAGDPSPKPYGPRTKPKPS